MNTIIRNVRLVNENSIQETDVFFSNGKIKKIAKEITTNENYTEIDGRGNYLLPGMIDDQVHFRDPGFAEKADIKSESFAAAAGGVTSFMDMPNTQPATLSLKLLEDKYVLAQEKSIINYSFFMGINKDNLEEALKVDNEWIPGITDDGLYFSDEKGILANYPDYLEQLFKRTETLVALHCENDEIIAKNLATIKAKYGQDIPFRYHPVIRSEEACYEATKEVISIAKKHNTRLHIYHVSTQKELDLLESNQAVSNKRITAEACVHHLHFTADDYETWGPLIKWNPAVKEKSNKIGLIEGLKNGKIDFIASDHAPHTLKDKMGNYFKSMSGGPLVQHSLLAVLELYHSGDLSLQELVKLTSHHVADAYKIVDRGYLKEGYYADAVLVNVSENYTVTPQNIAYKCGWSPFLGYPFKSKILSTWVNGKLVYDSNSPKQTINKAGMRVQYQAIR